MPEYTGLEIAVIGMAGRFPGASNVEDFWNNLKNGVESVSFFSQEELLKEGESSELINNPSYVNANCYLSDKECFDEAFFGYRPDEAKLMDPQMRVLHECIWHAIEDASIVIDRNNSTGLFLGASNNFDWEVFSRVMNQAGLVDDFSLLPLSNAKFASSKIAYLLNLKGPAIFNDTACSTSLVNIHQACRSLLVADCNIAIAGGVSIKGPSKKGYLYQEGMISSKDGHCRAFDESASGAISGEGVGVVVLKKLKKAIDDGDNIHAIIKGSSINNDGNEKVNYSAPSVNGQTQAIIKARKMAKVDPESIGYIEAHGTATPLGDPIEVEALNLAFGQSEKKYCALGSVKANIGHLDVAAGVAGFIKTVLALKNKKIPPSINYTSQNPKISFDKSPLYVNTELKDWENGEYPLRAGVSSFGIGGTNAHVILEEAPDRLTSTAPVKTHHLLTMSAKSTTSLKENVEKLSRYMAQANEEDLGDIAFSLNIGRTPFLYRKTVVCKSLADGVEKLNKTSFQDALATDGNLKEKRIVFMFPGQGAQYQNMCSDLYDNEKEFSREVDNCFRIVHEQSGKDLRSIIFSREGNKIDQTEFTQPALFIIEYSLAKLLISWGINPHIMIGHSVGEYVAACVAGVFSLSDALTLVVKRGELMQKMPSGKMLSIVASKDEIEPWLKNLKGLSIAAINSSKSVVVSGSKDSLAPLMEVLDSNGVKNKIISTSHAFHSTMMEGMIDEFTDIVNTVEKHPSRIPIVSNLTGHIADAGELMSSSYWTKQLLNTVKFSNGISEIMNDDNVLFIEVGPGRALGSFVGAHLQKRNTHKIVNLIKPENDKHDEYLIFLEGIGKLWQLGIEPRWDKFYLNEATRKISIPTYSFNKKKYPIQVNAYKLISDLMSESKSERKSISEWLYVPTWKISTKSITSPKSETRHCYIIFGDNCGISKALIDEIKKSENSFVLVKSGKQFNQESPESYTINSNEEEDFYKLFDQISKGNLMPAKVVHCWGITDTCRSNEVSDDFDYLLYSLLNSFKAFYRSSKSSKEIVVLTNDFHDILSQSPLNTVSKSFATGLLKVIGQEYPSITTGHIDVTLDDKIDTSFISKLLNEINNPEQGKIVAFRNLNRWEQVFDKLTVTKNSDSNFKQKGVYLITGGLGNFGVTLSNYLAESYKANLILIGRTGLPPRDEWRMYHTNDDSNPNIQNKIEKILAIERAGAQVIYHACDVSSISQLSDIIIKAEKEFGLINGVFHTAGVLNDESFKPINKLEREDFNRQLLPKRDGVLALNEVLGDKELDFCLITSSLSAVLGGVNFGAYSSANVFVDSFIKHHKRNDVLKNWMSVDFDGINYENTIGDAIRAEELPELINNILSLKEQPLLVASTKDIQIRIDNWINQSNVSEGANYSNGIPNSIIQSEDQKPDLDENQMLVLWQGFFGKPDIDFDDDFFDIGGDSLKALTLISRINKYFNVNIALIDFFENSTVRSLTELIDELDNEEHLEIKPADIQDYYLVSSAQNRLYFLHELDKSSLAYNLPQCYKLIGELEIDNLRKVFVELIARHESLRTSFLNRDNLIVQKIKEQVNFDIEYFDAKEADIDIIIGDFIRPFDLTNAPLIRVGLIDLPDNVNILMLDMHHIITDGTSTAILIEQFIRLYNGEKLPKQTLQYKDYTEWQGSIDNHNLLNTSKEFWLNEFDDEVTVLDLPTDNARPKVMNHQGRSTAFSLGENETKVLREISGKNGTTMFMMILSVFNILLSKLTNQKDVVIGTPVSGREHSDLESVVGMFVNTLAIRTQVNPDFNFSQFLQKVKEKSLLCFDNQSYQYEALIDSLKVTRNTNRNPLFDVFFMFQNVEAKTLSVSGLEILSHPIEKNVTNFDLTLSAIESDKNIFLNFEYSTELFQEKRIDQFIAFFQQIVFSIVADPAIKLSEIDILSKEEKHRLLYEFNDKVVFYPKDSTIVDLFELQVNRTPEEIAVLIEDENVTYDDLNKRSNQLAFYLQSIGIGNGNVVAICVDKSVEMIVGLLGILKAGGVYVPIDANYPKDRLDHVLMELENPLILSPMTSPSKSLIEKGEKGEIKLIILSSLNLSDMPVHNIESQITADSLAYIIYTSGSTGLPKGVMIQHEGLVNVVLYHIDELGMGPGEKYLQFMSLLFDGSVLDIFTALLSGATLVLPQKKLIEDPELFLSYLDKTGVTIFTVIPSYLSALNKAKMPLVKTLVTAGESCRKEDAMYYSQFKNFYNGYGPTEVTVNATLYKVNSTQKYNYSIPIGEPSANKKVYVLDEYLNLLPEGVVGELYIGGVGLSNGYLKNQELTSTKFIDNPFAPNEKIYKSGDLGRWMSDGNLEFLGRVDDQVKVNGFRIELGEIESQLLTHAEIKEVVVFAKEREEDKYLVGYYVSNKEIEPAKLRNYLSEKLPDYMLPTYYVHLDRLPLTSNGKVDRRSLPEEKIKTGDDYVAPRTEKEKILSEIWSKVLGVKLIGIRDNFFAVGGDSIKSIQISSRTRSAGYEVSVKDIFASQTIEELSLRLQERKRLSDQSEVTGEVALTGIQEWFFSQELKRPDHFNQSVMLNFAEVLTEEAVVKMFTKLQIHHDGLRMLYRQEGGSIIQENMGIEYPVSIVSHDLRKEKDSSGTLLTLCNEVQSSIDLEKGPLMKLGLFEMEEGVRLLIVIHHLVVDGISWRILFEDIETLYQQLKSGSTLILPLKTDSFKNWSLGIQKYVTTKSFKQSWSYWESVISTSHLNIEKDYDRGSNNISDTRTLGFQLDKSHTDQLLTSVHGAFNTQVNDILLGAFLMSIQKSYGHSSVRIDLEGHGREEILEGVDISRTIGWFTSIYPVALEQRGEELSTLLKGVKETLRNIPNNGIDYLIGQSIGQDTRMVSVPENRSTISFNYLGQFDSDTEDKAFTIAVERKGDAHSLSEQRVYDWDITGMISAGQLGMSLSYSEQQYKKETVTTLMGYYEQSLEELITYCCNYGKRELTPSDLTYKGLTIPELEVLENQYSISDVYLLSPMQEGLLFHSLLDSEADHYFEQISYRLRGEVDITSIEKSFSSLVKRYDILRTMFLHDGYERPIQVVLNDRELAFSFIDIRAEVAAGELDQVIKKYRDKDRLQKFNLTDDILMRVSVYQVSEEEYEFIWSHHHILMDGWCMSILINEFGALYQNYSQDKEIELPPVQPYSRYIEWLEERDKDGSAQYWQEYLKGYESLSSLPDKRELETNVVTKSKDTGLLLTIEQTKLLHQLSSQYGVTLNTIVQSVWGILLSRYNNVDDVVFGAVVSGRPAEISGIETMVGLFINTIPVRIDYQEGDKVSELLQRVQEHAIEGESHHYNSLSDIQSSTELGKGLIDHIMVFENYPIADQIEGADKKDNYTVSNVEGFEQTNYDLSITVVPGEQLSINFQYDSFSYDDGMIEGVKVHFSQIVDQITTDCEMYISDIDILSEAERHELLYAFNNTTVDYPRDKTIIDLFETQVEKTPENIALIEGNKKLNYKTLNARANQVARALKSCTIGDEEIIGVYTDRSIEAITAVLAILKVGATYLPIDVNYPEQRIEYMLKDSGVRTLLTNTSMPSGLANDCQVLEISTLGEDEEDLSNLNWNGSPDNLAYIMYTSGTTGNPKGVMIGHRSILRLVFNQNYVDLNESTNILLTGQLVFDATTFEIWGSLLHGGSLYIVEEKTLLDNTMLKEAMDRYCINTMWLTSSLFNQHVNENPNVFSSLSYLLVGGEALSAYHVNKVRGLYPATRMINGYGPTEGTTFSVCHRIVNEYKDDIPLGRPINNTTVYVLDRNHMLQPAGVSGELCIGGDGLARGYLNNEKLTAEKFIESPFASGDRLYKTGDLARWLPDGTIEYQGRLDDQVKIRGFRIELGEIESQLLTYDHIKEVVVLAKEREGDKYLIGYYVSEEEIELTALRDHLSEKLPDYMLPADFVHLDHLPLSTNGKVDRKALPNPGFKAGDDYVGPRNEIEEKLVGIWSEVLKIEKEQISVNRDFFELGGNSLKTATLSNKIHKECNVKIQIVEIFKKPTIGKLALLVEAVNQLNKIDLEGKEFREITI